MVGGSDGTAGACHLQRTSTVEGPSSHLLQLAGQSEPQCSFHPSLTIPEPTRSLSWPRLAS